MSSSKPVLGEPRVPTPLSPQAQLFSLSMSHFVTKSVSLTADLGIPDLLAEGPKHAEELARETKTEPRALGRMLRLVASAGILTETEPMRFALTPLGEHLRSDVPGSMRAWVRMTGSTMWYRTLADALYSLQMDRPCFEHALGAAFFDYLAQNEDQSAVFNRAMDDHGRGVSAAVVEAYDFSAISRAVDVGGGHGTLIEAILKAHPKMAGVLFDAPHVAESARQIIAAAGLSNRCAIEGGDFFRSVPVGADAYLLRWIVHDWEHDRALTILRNCARAMNESGRVLLVEAIVPPGDEPHPSKVLDFAMLTGLGGQERTREEYAALLREADLRLVRVVPTASPMSILEAVRA
jgi:hypothetical protein